jgi:hypothetical protein
VRRSLFEWTTLCAALVEVICVNTVVASMLGIGKRTGIFRCHDRIDRLAAIHELECPFGDMSMWLVRVLSNSAAESVARRQLGEGGDVGAGPGKPADSHRGLTSASPTARSGGLADESKAAMPVQFPGSVRSPLCQRVAKRTPAWPGVGS